MSERPTGSVETNEALAGPTRVVAGAGTGKTAVIADRFRQLVANGVDPSAILVMTFTERAAAEMRQRILSQPGCSEAPHVGTFHSLALRWLRDEASEQGPHAGFRILAGPDRWIFLREVMWELGDPVLVGTERPDDLVGPLLKLLERLKQELVTFESLAAWAARVQDPERGELLAAAARLFRAHAARSRRERVVDFDDLLLEVVRLFERNPEARARYSARFPWIMVDEYQDTNLAQERIVELVGGPDGNVCVVGDDDQSIYRFRGASRASMERFTESFPAATTVILGQNWRSSQAVVESARTLIERNPHRLPKPLSAAEGADRGPPVEVWRFETGEAEAAAIALAAAEQISAGTPAEGIGILVRTHAIGGPVADALASAGVPFRRWAGQGLFQRPEVRDVIAYCRLLHDAGDLISLARLLSRPPLMAEVETVLRLVRERMESDGERAVSPLHLLVDWPPTAAWAGTLTELRALVSRLGVDELLFELLDRTQHLEALMASARDRIEAGRVAANLGRFAELVAEYCERRRDHSLAGFVEYLELVQLSGVGVEEAELEAGDQAVQLMTIHQAKGLEFEAVFVPSLVEGRLPQAHRRDVLELPWQLLEPAVRRREDHVAEERRLLYVAMTRARRRLVLSWAERYEGARVWRPSGFLDEMAGVIRESRPPAPAALSDASGRGRGEPTEALGPDPELLRPHGQIQAEARLSDGPVLSFSAISSYRECPRQHWFRYQLRLPAPASAEAQFGTILHLVLMRAGRLRQAGRQVGLEFLRDLYLETWEVVGLTEPRRRPALEALGWRLLRDFWSQGGLAASPHLVEVPFTANLDGWTLRGIIDRVDGPPPPTQKGGGWELEVVGSSTGAGPTLSVDHSPAGEGLSGGGGGSRDGGDGGPAGAGAGRADAAGAGAGRAVGAWRLVDYKTGRAVPASRLRRDLQLALYALGARIALGLDPLELEIAYLKDGRRVVLSADEELLGEARRIGAEVAAGVQAGRFEPRPERRRCSLCAYRLACDAAL